MKASKVEAVKAYLVACREAQKSTTVAGICYHLDIPTGIDNLKAIRAILRTLRQERFVKVNASSHGVRFIAK